MTKISPLDRDSVTDTPRAGDFAVQNASYAGRELCLRVPESHEMESLDDRIAPALSRTETKVVTFQVKSRYLACDSSLPPQLRLPPYCLLTIQSSSFSAISLDHPNHLIVTFHVACYFPVPPMPSLISASFTISESTRGHSALLAAFDYLSSHPSWRHTLVGWTGELTGDSTLSPEQRHAYERAHAAPRKPKEVPVWLPDGCDATTDAYIFENQGRWRLYAELVLYGLLHYRQREPTDGRQERVWWDDYVLMSTRFADRIRAIYKPGDMIWIHDYHLFLLPALLRATIPGASIGFFLHTPFPSSELIRCLPHKNEILGGMLGSSLIGFQTSGYSGHFTSCCQRILNLESTATGVVVHDRNAAVDVFPIGIAAAAIEQYAFNTPEVQRQYERVKRLYPNKHIILGRDRLDNVKGIPQKLQAYHKLFTKYPGWKNKVILVQIVNRTFGEQEVDQEVNKLASEVTELVERITSDYGNVGTSDPIQYCNYHVSREQYFALLRVADIGLITSTRDGMNTTALEYIICQKDNHGSLMLSEFSGTAESLSDATQINPWDLEGVADALDQALLRSKDQRREVHKKLYNHVSQHTVQHWTHNFLDRLSATASPSGQVNYTPFLDTTSLLTRYLIAQRRLFMFDYDGTLTSIVPNPNAATPSEALLRSLIKLASDPKNTVWVISGRDQEFLTASLGQISNLGLSAEHGTFMRLPGNKEWGVSAPSINTSWHEEVQRVFQAFTSETPGSFIETKRVALTWHYRTSAELYGRSQANKLVEMLKATVATRWDVKVMEGKANVEVRPSSINKGEIVQGVLEAYSWGTDPESAIEATGEKPDLVFCAGDDYTDEDMFRVLAESDLEPASVFSCTVGPGSKQTLAGWHMPEPSDIVSAIDILISG